MRCPAARVASGLLLALAMTALHASVATALAQDLLGQYRFEGAGRNIQIPSIEERGSARSPKATLVSLRGIVEGVGGIIRPDDRYGVRVAVIADTALRFASDQPAVVVVGERVVALSRAVRRVGGDIYLPLDFLTDVVLPILERAPRIIAAPPAGSVAVPVAATAPPPAGSPAPAVSPPLSPTSPTSPMVTARPGAKPTALTFTVVIDPGHGGTETGAEGKKGANGAAGLFEKDVTLDVARRLRGILQAQPGLNVMLTRDEDAVIALDERTALANQNHADLFLSIHVNAAPRRDARGAETYFLSFAAKNEEIRTLAAMENNSAGVDKEKLGEAPEGLELVLWDLAQSQYLQESGELAGSIQKELNEALGARDRGVRQAPFRVLMGATMPAVLVEVGFISNPAEEASLATEEYRDKIAQALSRAVTSFLADARRRMGAAARTR